MQSDKKPTPWFDYPRFNWVNKHAVIIGGGLAGCQMAWHLCESGWQVTLIERHKTLSTEASGNPAGVISPKMTAKPSIGENFYSEAYHYTLALIKTLEQQDKSIDWQACGVLQLTHNQRETKRWQALKSRNLPKDFIRLLDEGETDAIAGLPLNTAKPYKSSYFPQGGWIKPASFAKALSSHPNCNIITQTTAIKLKKENTLWHVVDQNQQTIANSEVVVIANGKDLFNFEQSHFLAGMPVAGQTTLAPASAISRKLQTVIGHEGYLTPQINGCHIFGASFERDVSNPILKEATDNSNFESLQRYLGELAHSLTHLKSAHTAVRMTTPDRFPYVGALPDKDFYQKNYDDLHQGKHYKKYPAAQYQSGLFVLGGLGSRGIISSGLCAKRLVECIEGRTSNISTFNLIETCHPARFLIKSLKKNK
jgi:tRNA 5-methylaminomethyl-2-thiouridine biosynthesis bifunctional protein